MKNRGKRPKSNRERAIDRLQPRSLTGSFIFTSKHFLLPTPDFSSAIPDYLPTIGFSDVNRHAIILHVLHDPRMELT